jgi:serine/threonine protein phosphatase PrpC
MKYELLSDRGSERENNEDYARVLPERCIFVIADGMGGHVAGEVASHVAVDTFISSVEKQSRPKRIRDESSVLTLAMTEANQAVIRKAADHKLYGMGTTLTAVLIRGRMLSVAHVGDTRAYFVRGDSLQAITRDHTVVGLMVQTGLLGEEEAHLHPDRHMLLQALGTQEAVEADVFQARIPSDTRILLSSDGLHDVVPADEILQHATLPDLQRAATSLIAAANAHGGPDNITVVLIEP